MITGEVLRGTEMLKRAWIWKKKEEQLYRKLCIGKTLHVCSGKSRIGHVKVDLSERSDVKADLEHLPFRKFTFDTVLCDPPWSYYSKLRWILKLKDLARKRVILITPNLMPKLRQFKVTPYLIHGAGSHCRQVKLCLVYDRVISPISDYFSVNRS